MPRRFFGGSACYIAGVNEAQSENTRPSETEMHDAFGRRDPAYDGLFYVAVKTTGIFCRPSCPSRPNAANVEFFRTVKDCLFAGYRACRRCHPLSANGSPPPWVAELMKRVEEAPETRLRASDLREFGVTPERARRWFNHHYGMSFAAWCRGHRLAGAFTQIRNGANLDDVIFESGFESHSGFRDAFSRTFGQTPGRSRGAAPGVITCMIESPLGPLLAGANEEGICLLEFTDRRMLEHNLETVRQRFDCAIVPGHHPLLARLEGELRDYFAGQRRKFTVPIASCGTPFQEQVWRELRAIPYGETLSYEELARRVNHPAGQRAVARANGMNRICILIPCHRVIGKDGSLTGYGGGLWRKRLLLDLESKNKSLSLAPAKAA